MLRNRNNVLKDSTHMKLEFTFTSFWHILTLAYRRRQSRSRFMIKKQTLKSLKSFPSQIWQQISRRDWRSPMTLAQLNLFVMLQSISHYFSASRCEVRWEMGTRFRSSQLHGELDNDIANFKLNFPTSAMLNFATSHLCVNIYILHVQWWNLIFLLNTGGKPLSFEVHHIIVYKWLEDSKPLEIARLFNLPRKISSYVQKTFSNQVLQTAIFEQMMLSCTWSFVTGKSQYVC